MAPPTKKKRLAREAIELACEFSECTDKCHGIEQLLTHVSLHFTLMKDQFHLAVTGTDEDTDEVDNTKCECPWRGCETVLDVNETWSHCARHINFHAFHTYLKAIGDDELQRRNVTIGCTRDESQRNIIPDLPDAFVCSWMDCVYESDCPWTFYKHVSGHASILGYDKALIKGNDKTERFGCLWSSCNYTCTALASVTKVKDHLRTHTQERRIACSRCGALYCSAIRLVDHQKRESNGEKSFQCSHCLKKFVCERILRDHLRKHVNMYGCMFCDMTCPSPSALRIHILYRHSTKRPYNCSRCEKTFKTKFDLASHNLTHEYKDSVIVCTVEHCGYTCRNVTVLGKHTAQVHGSYNRVYGCHVCDELFDNSVELSKHLKTGHNMKYPAGHVKFRFAPEADGIYRLVTVRYECLTEEYDDAEGTEPAEGDSFAATPDGESLLEQAEAELIDGEASGICSS